MRGAERLPRLRGAATGVGSVPHRDGWAALRFVAATAPLVPYRPELVKRGEALGGDMPGHAPFLQALQEGFFPEALAIKGQVCGPLTASRVRGEATRALAPGLARRAAAEARALVAAGLPAMVVVDEPTLGKLTKDLRSEVIWSIDQLFHAIEGEGAVPGLHCCDDMDLSLLLELRPGLWSFDAFHGLELAMGHPAVQTWLAAGGRPIFGIVPTTGREPRAVERLEAIGSLEGCFVSASCGFGALSLARARRVAAAVRAVAEALG